MLTDILSRLVETAAEQGEDMQVLLTAAENESDDPPPPKKKKRFSVGVRSKVMQL